MESLVKFDFPHGIGLEDYAWIINYTIHDNMGNPYRVEVNKKNKTLSIFMETYNKETKEEKEKFLKTYNYSEIWPGIEILEPQWTGNTILFQERGTNKFIFIGNHGIEEINFPEGEEILILFSSIGNNDVPYAYAVGKKNIYLISEGVYFPSNEFDLSAILGGEKLYDEFYDTNNHGCGKKMITYLLAERDCPWTGDCKL